MSMDTERFCQLEQEERDYSLLCEMIQDEQPDSGMVRLEPLRKELEAVWQKLKDNAPPDFGSLYAEFQAEYEKLKDFLLYEPLIGKTIVALGGGFSCGKSSFLNDLMCRTIGSELNILPEDISPTTSVPTYLVHGEGRPWLRGVNIFDGRFELEDPNDVGRIAHGFGAIAGGKGGVKLGHIVRNLFLAVDFQPYEHIAFLDTPGYSAPGGTGYSAKTDEQIARQQLNTANRIIWLTQVEKGTMPDTDITFLKTLRPDIPKLVVLSKAEGKTPEELEKVRAHISSMLQLQNIKVDGILTYSRKDPSRSQMAELEQWLDQANRPNEENQFAINFKKLFRRTRDYYQTQQEKLLRQRGVLNQALTLTQDSRITDSLADLLKRCKEEIDSLKEHESTLQGLQNSFFKELKTVGSLVGLHMPEPSEIDLLGEARQDLLDTLRRSLEKKGRQPDPGLRNMLQRQLSGVDPVINRQAGGLEYRAQLAGLLSGILSEVAGRCRINEEVREEEAR